MGVEREGKNHIGHKVMIIRAPNPRYRGLYLGALYVA